MLDSRIAQSLVVSLREDKDRRSHIKQHFNEVGIINHSFIDGISHDADIVKQFYIAQRVKGYPSCFRCSNVSCNCGNNILIPQQVANWLSFKKAWVKSAIYDGLTLICEDDVLFYPGAMKLLSAGLDKIDLQTKQPLLIRLAHSGLETDVSLVDVNDVSITQNIVMSNVAFVLNQAMAKLLLANFSVIETTSDIFIHNWCAQLEQVNACTITPLLATDLSFNKQHAKFASRIHPKGINDSDKKKMEAHIKRVDSKQEYESLLNTWLNK